MNLNNNGLLVMAFAAMAAVLSGCNSGISKKDSANLLFVPTKTNQLKEIAYFPLISGNKSKRYDFQNNEFLLNLAGDCGSILIRNSEIGWALRGDEIPNRNQMQNLGETLKSDGVLTAYLEENGELNVFLLNLRNKSVWQKTFKQRESFRVSAREICKDIKRGYEFNAIPEDKGNKVVVLPIIDKNGGDLISSEWKALVELRLKSKGYIIVGSDYLPVPQYIDIEEEQTNIFIPKDMKLGKTDRKVSKLNVNISSIAAASGADWVVVATIDRFDYKNILIYQKVILAGKTEIFNKNGELVYTFKINTQDDIYGFIDLAILANVGYAAERLAGKSLSSIGPIGRQLKTAYLQLDIPRYW